MSAWTAEPSRTIATPMATSTSRRTSVAPDKEQAMNLPIGNERRDAGSASAVRPKPVAGSLAAALVASLCCGGSLLFASIGLGGLYATLGLFRYVPQFLAAGTLTIVAINWLYYRHLAEQLGLGCDCAELRRVMYLST